MKRWRSSYWKYKIPAYTLIIAVELICTIPVDFLLTVLLVVSSRQPLLKMDSEAYLHLPAFENKPRIAVLTDICNEPDDAQSLTRFLLYANEFSIRALVATTSTWQRNSIHKEAIYRIIDAYDAVWDNLNAHVPLSRQFPPPSSLREVVRSGIASYGMAGIREPLSQGARLLIQEVDETPADGSFWVLLWGGANVLAQALWSVQNSRSTERLSTFVRKLRVYSISDQDDAGPWLRTNFPRMFYIASIHAVNMYGLAAWTGISGEEHYGFDRGGPDHKLVTKRWLRENIQIGPYGKRAYPDPAFIVEGDTPTFLSLIQNGLTDPSVPEWGGWGGRYMLTDPSGESGHYGDAADTVIGVDDRAHVSNQATIWRWREAYQADFAARMQRTLSPRFAGTNHAPIAVVNGDCSLKPLIINAVFGETVLLDASQSWDPDVGNTLKFRWMQYAEPSSTRWTIRYAVPKLQIEDAGPQALNMAKVAVRLPSQDDGFLSPLDSRKFVPWGPLTYHIVLEVMDDGIYPLRAYRRVLIRVGMF